MYAVLPAIVARAAVSEAYRDAPGPSRCLPIEGVTPMTPEEVRLLVAETFETAPA